MEEADFQDLQISAGIVTIWASILNSLCVC